MLDTENARELAEFYRELLGLRYREGDQPAEMPGGGDSDWLVLVHIDMTAPSIDELRRQRQRAEDLGALLLLDRISDPDEPLCVLVDPARHPFCMFVP